MEILATLWAVLGTVLIVGAVLGAIVWAARRPAPQTAAVRAGEMLAGGQRFPAPPPVAGQVRFRGGYYTAADGRTSAWGSFEPEAQAVPDSQPQPAAGGGVNIAPVFHNYGGGQPATAPAPAEPMVEVPPAPQQGADVEEAGG